MSETAPEGPYIYQPFGVQNPEHWKSKRIYAIGGLSEFATVTGLSKDEANRILVGLNGEGNPVTEAARGVLHVLPGVKNPPADASLQRLVNLARGLLQDALEQEKPE